MRAICNECAGPGRRREEWGRHLRAQYGLTADQWDALYHHQGSGCALCGKPSSGKRRLHVDHDHATEDQGFGVVRGLLCAGCNIQVGFYERIRDDADYAGRIEKYLARPPTRDMEW